MRTISVSQLRVNILKYMEMAASGEEIEVTNDGQVLAILSPPLNKKHQARQQLSVLAQTALIYDVVSPVSNDWSAAACAE